MEDLSAERGVLSAILQKGYDAYDEVADLINPSSFTDYTNQGIYACCDRIFSENTNASIDYPTLMSSADTLGLKFLEKDSEAKYIRGLNSVPVGLDNVSQLAVKLRTLQIRRELLTVVDGVKQNLATADKSLDIENILGLVEKPIFDFTNLLNNPGQEASEIHEGLTEWLEYLVENPCETVGIKTGLDYFDEAIGGGVRRKSISVIGARAKAGKSILSDFFALKIGGAQKIPVLVLDTEMEKKDHWSRMLASMTGVLQEEIETGKFSFDEYKKKRVFKANDKLKQAKITYIPIPGASIQNVISHMRRWVRRNVGFDENGRVNDCVIIYDYLKLVNQEDLTRAVQEYQAIGFMMTSLHNFCHRYDVPLIAFVQLNRDGIEKESEAVISQSDRISWLCSNLSIFKSKTEAEIVEDGGIINGNKKLCTLICRHGPGMKGNYMNLHFQGEITRITPAKTQRQIHDQRQEDKKKSDVIGEEDIPFE